MHSQTHVCPVAFLESSTQITPSQSRPSRLIALKSAPLGSSPSSSSCTREPRGLILPAINSWMTISRTAWHVKCNQIGGGAPVTFCLAAERDKAKKRSGRRGRAGATIKEELAGGTRASDLKAAEFTETAACYFLNAAMYTEAHYINMFCLWTALDKFPLMESHSPSAPECLCVWCECFFLNMA